MILKNYKKFILIIILTALLTPNIYSNWLGFEIAANFHFKDSFYSKGGYGNIFINPEFNIILKLNSIFKYGFFSNFITFFEIGFLNKEKNIFIKFNEGLNFSDKFYFKSVKTNYCIGYNIKFKNVSYIPFIGYTKISIKENAFKNEYKIKYNGIKIGMKIEINMNKKRSINVIFKFSGNRYFPKKINGIFLYDLSAGLNMYINLFKRRLF